MRDNEEIFERMRVLNQDNSKMDLHMHTSWTDGRNTVAEMIKKADLNGLYKIAVTDHIRQESDYYLSYLSSIRENAQDTKMKVYCGFETKILNLLGKIDIPYKAYEEADVIIASVHRIPWRGNYISPREITYTELSEIELELALSVIRNKSANVVGHSGGMSISVYGKFPEEYFEKIVIECERQDIAFEFNYKYHSKYRKLLKELLYKYNPYVSVGSDAHNVDEILNRSFLL